MLDLMFFPGFKDGDEALSAANTNAYVGGSPLGVFADGLSRSNSGNNFVGMALNDRTQDSQNGKVGFAPRGSKGTLRPSLSPALDRLIIVNGVSIGDASLGKSNQGLFAKSLPITASNPAQTAVDPTDLGVTKLYPYDESKTYNPGDAMYVNVTSGKWTNAAGDAGATPASHATVVRVAGEDIVVLTH